MGKNEQKRAAAAAIASLNAETTEEERQAMLNKGMGAYGGLHKGEDQLFEKKLSKEEKKAAMEERKAALAAKKAAKKAAAAGAAAVDGAPTDGADGAVCASAAMGDLAIDDGAAASTGAAAPAVTQAKGAKSKGKSSKKGAAGKGSANSAAGGSGSSDLPFFPRTGKDAAKRRAGGLDVRIDGIRLCAGKQILLDSAVLALNHGRKYGLVGRNGVGKTTLLRSLAEGIIALPSFLHVVHVEQARGAARLRARVAGRRFPARRAGDRGRRSERDSDGAHR